MNFQDFWANKVAADAAKLVSFSMVALVARLEEVNAGLEALSDMVAEDASEAALFGDGPCGSAQRAADFHGLSWEGHALRKAIRDASDVGPKLPVEVDTEEIPF